MDVKQKLLAYNHPSENPRDRPEYVAMAAIYFDDKEKHVNQPINVVTGYVVTGLRHHNCWATKAILSRLKPSEVLKPGKAVVNISIEEGYSKPIQGFVTSKNRFLDRKEACVLAYLMGQIQHWEPNDELISEELY